MIGRREFITLLGGAAVSGPLAASAQQADRVRRVGVLSFGTDSDYSSLRVRKMSEELEKLGWIEGRNLHLEYRFGSGDPRKTRQFAADLIGLHSDVVVAAFGTALRALQRETKVIPIVAMGAGDLVQDGAVKNAARPEGNTTGFSNSFASVGGKWMELLKEAAPNITRVAFLPNNPDSSYRPAMDAAAQSLGIELLTIPIGSVAEVTPAVQRVASEPNGALIAGPGLPPVAALEVIRLAAQHYLPAVYAISAYLTEGALLTYTNDPAELYRGAASYVDRLLRGAKVIDLPVQYPTRFYFGINLKAAKTIGLTIPKSLLLRADEVIE